MAATDYERVEKAIRYLLEHVREQPGLEQIAHHLGLSRYHFQRLFRRWAGISPKRFLQYLTAAQATRCLERTGSVLEASYEAGLSGPGRLHDLLVTVHGVTPGELRRRGEGLEIRYGIHPGPFGDCLLAATPRGICRLAFPAPDEAETVLALLRDHWPRARMRQDPGFTGALAERIFRRARPGGPDSPIDLHLRGSNFQLKVWEALLEIPPGALVSYQAVARRIGQPGAARAVGAANARNPVALLIPCHRVIRQSGALGGYRWGTARKLAILGWERARLQTPDDPPPG